MPVFHAQRIIHIHNPRCGGSSINAVLWEHESPRVGELNIRPANYHYLYGLHRLTKDSVIELDHLDSHEIKSAVAPWVWNNYYKFVVVRHPWDKFVSEYRRKHQRRDHRFVSADTTLGEYCEDFLRRVKDVDPKTAVRLGRHQFADCHFLPQWRFAGVSPDMPDTQIAVLKLESLENDWQSFLGSHGFDSNAYALQRRNSQADHYTLDDLEVSSDVGALVETFYDDDFRVFGYERHFQTIHN
jgi:hypothetical protein